MEERTAQIKSARTLFSNSSIQIDQEDFLYGEASIIFAIFNLFFVIFLKNLPCCGMLIYRMASHLASSSSGCVFLALPASPRFNGDDSWN